MDRNDVGLVRLVKGNFRGSWTEKLGKGVVHLHVNETESGARQRLTRIASNSPCGITCPIGDAKDLTHFCPTQFLDPFANGT